jgi:hypothetical protein
MASSSGTRRQAGASCGSTRRILTPFQFFYQLRDTTLKGVPHYFYIDFGQTHEGMGNTLLVVVDKATTTIMSRVPKTYNGFPIKIKVITERQKYWKYNHPGDVPPGCVVSEGPGYRHLVCPVTKPDLRDPIGAP